MIRITGGKYRSRLLDTPNTSLTKPTMDKVRAAVFSALSQDKLGDVLDLFAGSGSYGFEALSRGASSITFVDKSKDAINVIKANAKKLGETSIDVNMADAINYVKETNKKFDVIFIDPPYRLEVYEELVNIITSRELLNECGIIVLESEKELSLPLDKFSKSKFYKYGLAKIYILRK